MSDNFMATKLKEIQKQHNCDWNTFRNYSVASVSIIIFVKQLILYSVMFELATESRKWILINCLIHLTN